MPAKRTRKDTRSKRSKRARGRGKAHERATAKALGGERTGVSRWTKGQFEDVEHPILSIECKSLARFAGAEIMSQAIRNAPEGKIPCTVVHIKNAPHSQDLVTLRMSDFQDLFGPVQRKILRTRTK